MSTADTATSSLKRCTTGLTRGKWTRSAITTPKPDAALAADHPRQITPARNEAGPSFGSRSMSPPAPPTARGHGRQGRCEADSGVRRYVFHAH